MDGDGCVGSQKVWGRFVPATYCRMSMIWGHSRPRGGSRRGFAEGFFFASEKNFNTMVAAVLAAANVAEAAAAATRPTNLDIEDILTAQQFKTVFYKMLVQAFQYARDETVLFSLRSLPVPPTAVIILIISVVMTPQPVIRGVIGILIF